MRTEDLIVELAQTATPVTGGRVPWRLLAAALAGASAALSLQFSFVGLRPDAAAAWPFVLAKLMACLAVASVWLWLLVRLAVPGAERVPQRALALGIAASIALLALSSPPSLSGVLGCISQVALLAIPAFAAVLVALRLAAPTRLVETGVVAGMLAGVIGTVGYSLGCMMDDMYVVALRYGLAISSCGTVGGLVGRYALRW